MTQEKYETTEREFWIEDEELNIDLKGDLEFLEKEDFPTGELRYEAYRKGEKLHGPSFFYSKSGQLLSQTWYYEGTKIGKVRRYYPTGQLYSLERYVDGVFHLAQEYFYLDGSLKTLIHFDKGVFDGETKLFWPDGIVKRLTVFSHGKKQVDEFYDEEGNLIGDFERSLS
ncbi:MAG: hypothetical protein K1000chlam2_01228 [Chlamydiae bacterium]|nr:hypothetical protein [Chlamydiota bacterium]